MYTWLWPRGLFIHLCSLSTPCYTRTAETDDATGPIESASVCVCVSQRYGRRWVAGCILVGCRFWSVSEPSHSPKSGSYSILRKYWLPRSSLPTSSPLVNRSASLCWAFPSLCVSLAPEPNHFDRLMMTHQTANPRWLTQQTASRAGGDALKIQSVKNNVSHEKRPPQLGRLELTELQQKEKQKNPSGWGAGGRSTKEGRVVEREGGTMAATQMARFKSREYLDLVKSIASASRR